MRLARAEVDQTVIEQGPTTRLAEFATNLSYDKLGPEVVQHAKECLLDYLRLVVLGASTPWAQAVYGLVKQMGGAPESRISVYGDRVPMVHAALAHGTFSHGLEWSDSHLSSMSHPSDSVFPAAIAAAEKLRASGKDLITATVAGYDVMLRIGDATMFSAFLRGFHAAGTIGPFGAAIAAGKLLQLNCAQMRDAIGVAASHCGGLLLFLRHGERIKRIHGGKGAQAGVWSALMAQSGITAPPNILEAPDMGFCRAYTDEYDLDKLTAGLGTHYLIMDTMFKVYASGRIIHAPIEAAEIFHKRGVDYRKVKEIEVHIAPLLADRLSNPSPTDILGAQLSIPFAVSAMLIRGSAEFRDFVEGLSDPRIHELCKTVRLVGDPEFGKAVPLTFKGRVILRMNDGEAHSITIDNPRGEARNPLRWPDIEERFRRNIAPVLKKDAIDEIVNLVSRIEELDDVSRLTDLLVSASPPGPASYV